MATFVISSSTNSQYLFTFHADNGQNMLTSELYVSKQSAIKGAESAKVASSDDSNYDRRTASNLQPYFVLKAVNGQILATSETYSNTYARDLAIEKVKDIAPTAPIVDRTQGDL